MKTLFRCVAAAVALSLAAAPVARAAEPVRAQDDLYLAANGEWLAATEIPANRARVLGTDLSQRVDDRVRALVQALKQSPAAPGSAAQQVASFQAAYLDTAAIERAGLKPLQPLLRQIDALHSVRDLSTWMGQAQGRLQTPIWCWGGFADFRDPGTQRVMLWQGGLGLPERAHYWEPAHAAQRQAYLRYLTELARLAGLSHAAERAQRVLALETRIAEAHLPLAEARDPARMLNPMTAAQLQAQAPGLDWPAFVAGAGLPADEALMVTQRSTAVAVARLVGELPLADWQDYLRLRTLDEAAVVLPAAFRRAHFEFYGRALNGTAEPQPRAEQAAAALSSALAEPLAQLYVERHFSASQRQQVQAMVQDIVAAYREILQANTWLSAGAKTEALAKLDTLRAKVGYPARWGRVAQGVPVHPQQALGNRQRLQQAAWRPLARANGQPVDRDAWAMSPLVVNAFYDPMQNEINLPAAHLQAPWFDANADAADNFGALGALIAHEIGHAFDPMGAQFDAQGRLRSWWTEQDRSAYQARSAQLVAQAARFEVLPGLPLKGEQTMAENAADQLGLQAAFAAYRRSAQGQAAGALGAQRFFLAYARSWRAKTRDEALRTQVAEDVHAPASYRTNGAAVNLDGFHEAFGTREGDRMFKPAEQRIRVW